MDRRRKVELFEEIRREYRFGVGTIQGVAKKLKTHRRMVRQALASAIPPGRKAPARSRPKLSPVREFINEILQSDLEAPRKQRHTAHRIWERIRQEHPAAAVAEATVRRYVQQRKEELRLAARETCVPQRYDGGRERRVKDLGELNEYLRACCQQDEQRRITGKPHAVGEAMRIERQHLLPLAAEGFELAETSFPVVDGQGCVKVRTNRYSVPLRAGSRTQARLLPAYVEVWHDQRCVARHERSFARYQPVLDLEHYLDVLERKPGALAGSTPLQQWRERGRWPESFDQLWQSLRERHGKQAGTREMIELLRRGPQHGWEALKKAVQQALALGCTDAAAVRHLLTAGALTPRQQPIQEIGALERYQRPLPVLTDYDVLLGTVTP